MSASQRLTWALVPAVLTSLASCQLFVRQTSKTECRANSDCVSGDVCFFRRCVTPERDAVTDLLVEITPPQRIALPPQQQELTMQRERGRTTLKWTAPSLWRVDIKDNVGHAVNGQLILRRDGLIPGHPISFAQKVPLGPFSIQLEPGEYDVSLIPDPSLLLNPPHHLEPWRVKDEDDFNVIITYPAPQVSTISGRLTTTAQDLLFPGFEGATVSAQVDGQQVTSTTTLSAANGNFSIAVIGPTGTFRLSIGPSNVNTTLPQIERTKNPDGTPLTLSRTTQLGDIYLGDLGSPIVVTGLVTAEDTGLPLANVAISAEAPIAAGSYKAGTITDANGKFSLKLLRGDPTSPPVYTLRVASPLGTPYSRREVTYALQATGEPAALALTLPPRTSYTGKVLDPSGNGVARASVVARNESGDAATTTTRADGSFELYLDTNVYTLTVVPASGAKLARLTARAFLDPTNESIDLTLPPVALVAGELQHNDKSPFTFATIDFYRVTDDGTELVGQATVDDKNHFSVALPAE